MHYNNDFNWVADLLVFGRKSNKKEENGKAISLFHEPPVQLQNSLAIKWHAEKTHRRYNNSLHW